MSDHAIGLLPARVLTPAAFPLTRGSIYFRARRHEIAFILGQLADPHSIPALVEVLKRENEAPMVRHEAAEALGGIPSDGSDGGTVLQLLREWAAKHDAPDVVRDSCVVAVDMWEVRIYFRPIVSKRSLTRRPANSV